MYDFPLNCKPKHSHFWPAPLAENDDQDHARHVCTGTAMLRLFSGPGWFLSSHLQCLLCHCLVRLSPVMTLREITI